MIVPKKYENRKYEGWQAKPATLFIKIKADRSAHSLSPLRKMNLLRSASEAQLNPYTLITNLLRYEFNTKERAGLITYPIPFILECKT